MEVDKVPVCVTGGNGFIGSWLIMRLLQQGYSVRTTIRSANPESNNNLSYLTNLQGASERLQIFKADLEEPDSFKAAIEGCVGVFHVAHPMDKRGEQPEEVVSKWAMEGTLGILRICQSSNTVNKVIFTSSVAAVMFKNFEGIEMVDETIWSDLEIGRSITGSRSSYFVSKTLTEKAVLEFGKENEMKLKVVSFVLPLVVGPFLCPKMPAAISMALSMILGEEIQCKSLRNTYMVHVDDVARGLTFLFENNNVEGRFICGFHQVTFHQLHELISRKYPQYHITIPDNFMGAKDDDKKYPRLSYQKLQAPNNPLFLFLLREHLFGAFVESLDKSCYLPPAIIYLECQGNLNELKKTCSAKTFNKMTTILSITYSSKETFNKPCDSHDFFF